MSHAISLQRPTIQHQSALQLEQNQQAGNSTWLGTAAKGTLIALGVIASIVSFAILPVASALLATGVIAILAIGGLSCFSSNPGHSHPHHYHHSYAPATPWYSRIFTPYPSHYAPFSVSSGRSNVPFGRGAPPRAPAPRSDVPVFNPFGPRPPAPTPPPAPPAGRGRGFLGLGRGHDHAGRGRGIGGPGGVDVGGGHAGRGGTPVGPGGAVGRGGGHFHPGT